MSGVAVTAARTAARTASRTGGSSGRGQLDIAAGVAAGVGAGLAIAGDADVAEAKVLLESQEARAADMEDGVECVSKAASEVNNAVDNAVDKMITNLFMSDDDFEIIPNHPDVFDSEVEACLTTEFSSVDDNDRELVQDLTEKITQHLVTVENMDSIDEVMARDEEALAALVAPSSTDIQMVADIASAAALDPELQQAFARSVNVRNVIQRHIALGNLTEQQGDGGGVSISNIVLDMTPMLTPAAAAAMVTDAKYVKVESGGPSNTEENSEFSKALASAVDKVVGALNALFAGLMRSLRKASKKYNISKEDKSKRNKGTGKERMENLLQAAMAVAAVVVSLLFVKKLGLKLRVR